MISRKIIKRVFSFPSAFVLGWRLERARILCYHSVADPPVPGQIAKASFARQVDILCKRSVITISEALAGRPGLAVMFDDAYASVAENAAPLLARASLPYAIAVPTHRVGGSADWDVLPPAFSRTLMTWHQLKTLPGDVSFLPHGAHHRRLVALDERIIQAELRECRDRLRQEIGERYVDVIVWPFGDASDVAGAVAAAMGFKAALAGGWGSVSTDEAFEHRRTTIDHDDSPHDFGMKLRGGSDWLDIVRRCRGR